MAGILTDISQSPTGNPFVDGLIAGGNIWNLSTGPIMVKIANANNFSGDGGWAEAVRVRGRAVYEPTEFLRNGSDTSPWTDHQTSGLMTAAATLEAVSGIRFQFTSSFAEADISWWQAIQGGDFPGEGSFIHEAPTETGQTWGYFASLTEGHWDFTPGGLGFQKMMAFAAKGVGLTWAHQGGFPGVDDAVDRGLNNLNAAPNTMMTFNNKPVDSYASGVYGFMKTPSAFDIAALQALYGVNPNTGSGDNRYELPDTNVKGTGWTTIWDTGGIDTISGERCSSPVSINLNAASLAPNDPNAGGFFSRQINIYGGFSIANGVVIENATGGTGGDLLVGNAVANVLNGGLGDDTYYISAGDTVIDTGGNDTVYADFAYSNAAIERIVVNGVETKSSSPVIKGSASKDKLVGTAGNDVLSGGLGNDTLKGLGGQDTFLFNTKPNSGTNCDKIVKFVVADDTIQLARQVFNKIATKSGVLKATEFWKGKAAHDGNDHIIYDQFTGNLFYDRDGNGDAAAVKFAILDRNLKLKASDFVIV